MVKSISV